MTVVGLAEDTETLAEEAMRKAIIGAGLAVLLAASGSAGAQEYGDAPASYGELTSWGWYQGGCTLGNTADQDPAGPRGHDWVSDSDDGVVNPPTWDSWSDNNTLTVQVNNGGHLIMWVDANDNGTFEDDERYEFSPGWVGTGLYTFDNIRIKATQRFTLNGTDKVGVRITIQDPMGGNPTYNTDGYFWFGEIEDWLIDVQRPKFAVEQTKLDDAIEGEAYSVDLAAVNQSGPFTWALTAGALPPGMTLVQSGDLFALAGTPAAGSGAGRPDYSFTVSCTAGTETVFRDLTLSVWPPAFTAPFTDTFSNDLGWKFGGDWARTQAQAFTGSAINYWGEPTTEPATDATPGSTDNMLLNDTPAAEVGDIWKVRWATSPFIDCSALSTVTLRYRRWHSLGDWDHARVMVSSDGVNWTLVWKPIKGPYLPVSYWPAGDTAWTTVEYDISAVAAGKSRVQVRIGLGFVNVGYRDAWGGAGYCGMCIDDLFVGAGPSATGVAMNNFDINSAATFVPSTGGSPLPVMYENAQHAFAFQLDNLSGEDVIVDEFEGGVWLDWQPGNPGPAANWDPNLGWNGWLPAGTFTLDNPLALIPDATTGYGVTGVFHSVGIPYQWLQPTRMRVYLRGRLATSGKGVLLSADVLVGFYPGAQPGMEVWDAPAGSSGANQVDNGDAPAGLRDFGSRLVGTTSPHTYIICKSTTSNTFTVQPPQITGPDAAQFVLYTQVPWDDTPAQGQNDVWFTIRFAPTSPGLKTATVSFTHTAPNTGTPFTFEIQGTGVTSTPALRVLDNLTGNDISNGSPAIGGLDFGAHDFNAGPLTRRFDIENQGGATLVIGLPMMTTTPATSEFTIDTSGTATSIPAGQSTSFFIHFAPSSAGSYAAQFAFTHNDTGTSTPFLFNVAGMGVLNAPQIRVTLGSVHGTALVHGAPAVGATDFGDQDVHAGATAGLEVFIHNDGWQDLILTNWPTLVGSNVGDFLMDIGQTSVVIGANQHTSFMLWFDPLAKGPKQAMARIEHNDAAAGNVFEFHLRGNGLDPNGVVMSPLPLAPAKVGVAYSDQLTASGGTAPYSFSHVNGILPAGLALAADGTISGTPTGPHGLYRFRVRVTDALFGTDEMQVELPVAPPIGHIGKDPAGNPAGCNVGHGSHAWLLALLLLAPLLRRRKA